MDKKWNHDELASDLATHLAANNDLMIWEDMQLGPSGSPRPDVYTIRKSYTNPRPMAYEIKISVTDFRSDITSGKWMKYLKYGEAVYFCVPKGLVTKNDIPNGCGLLVRSEKGWRSAKKPTLNRVEFNFDVYQKLLIDGISQERSNRKLEYRSHQIRDKFVREKMGEDVAAVIRDIQSLDWRLRESRVKAISMIQLAESRSKQIIDGANAEAIRKEGKALETWSQMCRLVDIPLDSSYWDLSSKVDDMKKTIKESTLLKEAHGSIKYAISQMNKSLDSTDIEKLFPEEK